MRWYDVFDGDKWKFRIKCDDIQNAVPGAPLHFYQDGQHMGGTTKWTRIVADPDLSVHHPIEIKSWKKGVENV